MSDEGGEPSINAVAVKENGESLVRSHY